MAKEKRAKTDFLEENLPQTRKEQFFDLLKNQYKVIFFVGLMLLLLFIPDLVKNALKDVMNDKIHIALKEAAITQEQANSGKFITWLISSAIDLVLYPIVFTGILGLLRVIRQMIYGEPVVFKYDFSIGYKENFKSGLLLGFLVGLTKFVFDLVIVSFASSAVIQVLAYVIFLLILLPMFIVCAFYSVIYKNRIGRSLGHSFLLYLKGSWRILLVMVVGILPFLLLDLLLNWVPVKQFIFAILLLFFIPLVLLAGFMVMNFVFDEAINIAQYPSLYRKGLYISKEEEKQLLEKQQIIEEVYGKN